MSETHRQRFRSGALTPSSATSHAPRVMTSNDPYSRSEERYRDPPRGFRETLRELGPGMILVGSVVGSGELIVTTKLGAVAGFGLLWFVLLSCFVKVVVQTELARYTIASGQTFLTVFNTLPGPAAPRPNWLTVPWMAGFALACVAALAVYMQLDESAQTLRTGGWLSAGVAAIAVASAWIVSKRQASPKSQPAPPLAEQSVNWFTWLWLASLLLVFVNSGAILGGAGQVLEMVFPGMLGEGGARFWSILVAVLCGGLLLRGTYESLERSLVALVSTFTLLTVVCTVLLHWTGYSFGWSDISQGLAMSLPDELSTMLILTALAMYAGTGVAFGEMWNYTYWCVEKGYAANVGAPQAGGAWQRRAQGWIRVMYTDAGLTMIVYTVSTVCFYILGAAILHIQQINPDGRETVEALSSIYIDGLGDWAAVLFIVGAFFVLFTTVLSGAAGNSRLMADALAVIGVIDGSQYAVRMRYIRIFVVVSLAFYAVAYWIFENPPQMLLVTSSLIAAVMYPVLGLGTLYLRHRRLDSRITPGGPVTAWLWVCGLILAVISPAGIVLALAINSGWIRLS